MATLILKSLFFCSVIIQLFYLLYFFRRLAFYKFNYLNTDINIPISVIICVHNEFENIKKLIPKVLKQNYPEFELIIVDDRSSDEVYDYLLFESAKHNNFRLVRINKAVDHITPKKYALSLGIKAAKYDHILFSDADCMPQNDNWIAEIQKGFSGGKEIVLGFSPYLKQKGLINSIIQFETFYTALQYFSFALAGLPYMGVGRNLAYKKSLFNDNKGFHKHLNVVGGDDDLFVQEVANKNNTAIIISENSFTYSIPKKSIKEWFVQKKRHLSAGKYYKTEFKILLGLLPFSQALFWGIALHIILIQGIDLLFLAAAFIRLILYFIILRSAALKLKVKMSWYGLPLFDLIYVFYFFITGITALFTKRVRWS